MKICLIFLLMSFSVTCLGDGDKSYFIATGQYRDITPSGASFGSDKGLVFGLLGKKSKDQNVPLERMQLMTEEGFEAVEFESVVKNCHEYPHPLDGKKYKICQDYGVFKYEKKAKPLMLFNFPFDVKNVQVIEWKPITDWGPVMTFFSKKEVHSALIESDFFINVMNRKGGAVPEVQIFPKGGKRPSRVFDLNKIKEFCGGAFYLDWISLDCSTIQLFFKDGQYIVSGGYNKTGVERGASIFLKATFNSKDFKYYFFNVDWAPFGKLLILREDKNGKISALKNSFKLVPMDSPVMP